MMFSVCASFCSSKLRWVMAQSRLQTSPFCMCDSFHLLFAWFFVCFFLLNICFFYHHLIFPPRSFAILYSISYTTSLTFMFFWLEGCVFSVAKVPACTQWRTNTVTTKFHLSHKIPILPEAFFTKLWQCSIFWSAVATNAYNNFISFSSYMVVYCPCLL